jgi:hypothetical protein
MNGMYDPDRLIDELARTAGPVSRVPATWVRVAWLIPLALLLGALSSSLLHREATDWAAANARVAIASALLSLAIGTFCLMSALSVSVAGRVVRGKYWAVALLLLWIALAIASIGSPAASAAAVVQGHHGTPCFVFVTLAGLPMILLALLALRQTRSLTPVRSLALTGCGAAFLAFALLALCHPTELSLIDLVMHVAAALVLGGSAILLGRRIIAC